MAQDDDDSASDESEQKHEIAEYEEHSEVKSPADSNKEKAGSKGKSEYRLNSGKFWHVYRWVLSHKRVSIPAAVVTFLVLIFVVPFTRYLALGLVLEQDFPVVVVDSETGKPVSSALVSLGGKNANTDGEGRANLRTKVGGAKLSVTKTYYNSASESVVVSVRKSSSPLSVKLKAIGRPVPITVVNGINGKAVAGAKISAGNAKAETDDKGQAVLVLLADSTDIKAKLEAVGYNQTEVTIKSTTQDDPVNKFKVTPAGKIYFSSNLNGSLDVVKSDLDGKNRQTVLAGTGKESKDETVLLVTRDWKYLALLSKRDGGDNAKLFLINTADDSLSTIDEGDADFTITGWDDHHFVYRVDRHKLSYWQAKKQALKSYDADTKKLTTLDETTAQGSDVNNYMSEYFGSVYILGHAVVYVKNWQGQRQWWMPDLSAGKQATLNSVSLTATNKKLIKGFAPSSPTTYINLDSRAYGIDELYLRFLPGDGSDRFYEFGNGKVKDLPDMKFTDYYSAAYATYLISPSGKKLFWSEVRDGRTSLFVSDADKDISKAGANIFEDDYSTYGWFTDDYLLMSKKGSELYIEAQNFPKTSTQLLPPIKITDYYRPSYSYPGYGGGYGGL